MFSKGSAILLLCLYVGASNPAAAQTGEPSQAPEVIRWQTGAAGADSYFENGLVVKSLTEAGITVAVSIRDTGWKTRADVSVTNDASVRVDVVPADFTLTLLRGNSKGKHEILRYQDPAKMAKSLRRRVIWANAFTGAAAGMARQTSTSTSSTTGSVDISDDSGNSASGTFDAQTVTTTTKPDYRAHRNAEKAERARVQDLTSALAYLDKVALKADTLMPGQSVSGAVYFARDKHHKPVVLAIPVGNTTFQFPFVWEKK